MNADGSAGVSLDASVGVKASWVLPAGDRLLVAAAFLAILGTVLLVVGATGLTAPPRPRQSRRAPSPYGWKGHLDEQLSRWLWLVKWILLNSRTS